MTKFNISAFADEAATDFSVQLSECKKHGIGYIELRNFSIGSVRKNISDATAEEAMALKTMLDEANIGVSSIGSHYGKIEITDDFGPHFEYFKKTVEVARILEARYIRVFSFFFTKGERYSEYGGEVIRRLREMTDYAIAHGIVCCHENEKDVFGDIPERCAELLGRVDGLGCIFDPANFIQCGVNSLDAYALLKDKITYFHIKDCCRDTGFVVPCGHGDGHIREILSDCRLAETFVTLEPHLRVFDGLAELDATSGELAERNVEYTYSDNLESFAAAADALKKTLSEIGGNA